MTPKELLKQTARRFEAAGIPDPEVDSALILSHLTGKPMLNLRLDADTPLDGDLLARFEAMCLQRLTRQPLQYVLGGQPFMGRDFHVDERVLIPRPETELLCEWAIEEARRFPAPAEVLDLCCGSGCLGVSLSLALPGARVHAADLSGGALEVTELNARRLGAQLTLHRGDLFAAVVGLRFHLIVSNPPYIPAEECRSLQPEVLREPLMALDGGPDGLDFYRRIAREAAAHLHPGGVVLLEVGHDQAHATAALMEAAGFRRTCIHNDLQGIARMVAAYL